MKNYKNEEHSRLPKLIMEAAMFLKMQNFSAFISRPFFSEFFGRANRALSSQFYRARRKNSEPGKKTMLDGRLHKLCVGGQG